MRIMSAGTVTTARESITDSMQGSNPSALEATMRMPRHRREQFSLRLRLPCPVEQSLLLLSIRMSATPSTSLVR